ncbi:Pyruvate dehydrogenase [Dirofilaria immitis]
MLISVISYYLPPRIRSQIFLENQKILEHYWIGKQCNEISTECFFVMGGTFVMAADIKILNIRAKFFLSV